MRLGNTKGNEAIFNRIMNDEAFKTFIAQKLMLNVFENIKRLTSDGHLPVAVHHQRGIARNGLTALDRDKK